MKKSINDIKITKSQKDNTCSICVEGDVTLKNINSLRKKVVEAFAKCDGLHVRIANVTSIDLSFIQLLYSLSKTEDSAKSVAIEMTLNDDAALLFERTGLGSLLERYKPTN